jgi:hypothetical protein
MRWAVTHRPTQNEVCSGENWFVLTHRAYSLQLLLCFLLGFLLRHGCDSLVSDGSRSSRGARGRRPMTADEFLPLVVKTLPEIDPNVPRTSLDTTYCQQKSIDRGLTRSTYYSLRNAPGVVRRTSRIAQCSRDKKTGFAKRAEKPQKTAEN